MPTFQTFIWRPCRRSDGPSCVNKRITGYHQLALPPAGNSLSGDGLANLVRHMREQEPDFTAVTGDLVNLGLEAEANTAWNWLADCRHARTRSASRPATTIPICARSFAYNNDRWGDYMRGETLDAAQFPFVRRVGDVAIISCSVERAERAVHGHRPLRAGPGRPPAAASSS
ncbi:MAG: hypothetical protein QM687_09335 [Ferruginibacter sp.]